MLLTGTGVLDDLLVVDICAAAAMLNIWLKSVEFEGIKITLKDW